MSGFSNHISQARRAVKILSKLTESYKLSSQYLFQNVPDRPPPQEWLKLDGRAATNVQHASTLGIRLNLNTYSATKETVSIQHLILWTF